MSSFYGLTSLEHDKGTFSERQLQSQAFSNYTTEYYNSTTPEQAKSFATEQPYVNYTMGKNTVGLHGSSVDDFSNLMKSETTNIKGKICLSTRPYLSIPFLGRGQHVGTIFDHEETLRFGDQNSNRKTAIGLSEVSTNPEETFPMINEVKNKMVGNVEQQEIRDGIQSRDINKQHLNNSRH